VVYHRQPRHKRSRSLPELIVVVARAAVGPDGYLVPRVGGDRQQSPATWITADVSLIVALPSTVFPA
jgi:hypothetical protein